MRDDVLVRADGVRKKFCRSLKRSLWYGAMDLMAEAASRQWDRDALRTDEFWAVDDVSFELRRGDCLGLIGRNGAGKTTLLKMLNGLIKLDRGRIEMRGRVGALIALGAGFNPILSGRENVFVNGSVLGLSKREIEGKLDEIVDFAELAEFIDSPVQSYSSGMQVRLGFAIATALDPDVLLIDEVLAVGDAMFRSKCYNRIDLLRERCGLIFVSHSMEQVGRICSRTLVMNRGRGTTYAAVTDGISAYEALNALSQDGEAGFVRVYDPIQRASVVVVNHEIADGGELAIVIEGITALDVGVVPRVVLHAPDQPVAAEANWLRWTTEPLRLERGSFALRLTLPSISLKAGTYAVSVLLYDETRRTLVHGHRAASVTVRGSSLGETAYQLKVLATHA
jgi:lipopolysaccharide transport system ATP-binding protein